MMPHDDTIVAIATGAGRGAIAIVRLSGPAAHSVARRVATPVPSTPRVVSRGAVHAPDDPSRPIDHALITVFAGPASYTGEDAVEFAVHGGPLVSMLVVEACVAAGARPARPGEFTERAVLHGKMDLVQAEAVADLIDARSRAAHRAALRQLDGALSHRLAAMRDALLQLDALLAYDIDFPEEDDAPPTMARVLAACDDALARLNGLLATLPAAALGREGALVVLAGPPNAGKSALLNALVGEARVLVSEMPGTTRDAVEVLVDDEPFPLRLVDTAGLRPSDDLLERMGIEVSERYVAQAHVVLACAETDAALASTCAAITTRTRGAVIAVRTKSDLHLAGQHDAGEGSAGKAVGAAAVAVRALTVSAVAVSAVTGHGLAALRGAIRTAVGQQIATPDDDLPVITRARHEAALRHARDELLAFRGAWAAASLPAPVAATHLRAAVTALESLIGAVDTDDVLDRVFRTFCIGK